MSNLLNNNPDVITDEDFTEFYIGTVGFGCSMWAKYDTQRTQISIACGAAHEILHISAEDDCNVAIDYIRDLKVHKEDTEYSFDEKKFTKCTWQIVKPLPALRASGIL